MPGTDAPATAWVASGAASLTGLPDGPGLVPPDAVLARIAHLGRAAGVDPWAALAERAAVVGLRRAGQVSCGGGTRLLPASDGWLAVSLVRPEDVELVPAWLEVDAEELERARRAPGTGAPGTGAAAPDVAVPWPLVAAGVAGASVAALVDRGILLGLPVAAVGEASRPPGGAAATAAPASAAGHPVPVRLAPDLPGHVTRLAPPGRSTASRGDGPPVVVDLSSLWAGPLCARILGDAGALVVKVEATTRPDGARRGPAAFYDRLHAGHRAVALDLGTDDGRGTLRALVAAADVVIEASRPRALAQMGIEPGDLGPDGPRVWVSITGHGRSGASARRVGFGDDAAVAGGLVAPTAVGPVFVGDAVADPLTGLAASALARHGLDRGGRWLVDLPLAGVAAWVASPTGVGPADDDGPDGTAAGGWREVGDPPPPPPVAVPHTPAPAHGADTAAVLGALRAGRTVSGR